MTASTMAGMPAPTSTTVNGAAPVATPHPVVPAHPAAPGPQAPATRRPAPAPKIRGRWPQKILVALAYVMATVAAADGMWTFVGDTLHVTYFLLRLTIFAVFEVAVCGCAVGARRNRIDDIDSRFGGVEGIAVWVFAALSGLASASHEATYAGASVRFVLPLVAAFLFERLTTAEQRDARRARGERAKKITFKFSPTQLMVRLGLADASDRSLEQVAQDRALARLATLRVRARDLRDAEGWWKKKRAAAAKAAYRVAMEKANERFGIATNPALLQQLRASVRLLNQTMDLSVEDATEAENLMAKTSSRSSTRSSTGQIGATRTSAPSKSAGRKGAEPTKERRPAAETLRLYDEFKIAQPGLQEQEYADLLEITYTRLGQILRQFGRRETTS